MREGMTMESTKMCVVYILHSASTERFDTGHTSDLDRRLREHKTGREDLSVRASSLE